MLYAVKLATCFALAFLAVHDVRFRRLPTRAVLLVAGLYFVGAPFAQASVASLASHLGAAAMAFAIAAVLFHFGWLGGGDAKLAAAVFLWAGPPLAWPVLFIVSSCGLVLGLAMLAIRVRYRDPSAQLPGMLALFAPARGVPYGVALALGGMAAVWPLALRPLLIV
ncbi:hypothetical protein PTE30175_00844 [Pandoraea terrae]|uniref:Prepilin type IV endopeptidase peptidase domain-containing protein n=1 Tax=Pandoraea terrae TaxID=1537710 RepID=A0A5E4SS25_9BURK|nr:prepilin peptidase [Pandoraea terrae]VVD76639.1 hypothetical protein PTE30175_00844 [Pandoraea terrae]